MHRLRRGLRKRERIQALPKLDRALWATAFYAGLRNGELRALRVENVNLDSGVIHVHDSWDEREGRVDPKSRAGVRSVPVCAHLRAHLEPHVEHLGHDGFVFGSADRPFHYGSVRRRTLRAWAQAELQAIGLHDARHSFSTYLDHAGVSPTRADRYMGHADHGVAGRYRHQLDGQLSVDAARLDDYLRGATAGIVVALEEVAA